MERVHFIPYQQVKILLIDVSNMAAGKDFEAVINQAKYEIRTQPKESVLTLFDATGTFYDPESIQILKDFTKSNKPYVKASAVVGITGLKKIALETISRFSGRTFQACNTREEALAWLARQ